MSYIYIYIYIYNIYIILYGRCIAMESMRMNIREFYRTVYGSKNNANSSMKKSGLPIHLIRKFGKQVRMRLKIFSFHIYYILYTNRVSTIAIWGSWSYSWLWLYSCWYQGNLHVIIIISSSSSSSNTIMYVCIIITIFIIIIIIIIIITHSSELINWKININNKTPIAG